jgi:hypothetical protein
MYVGENGNITYILDLNNNNKESSMSAINRIFIYTDPKKEISGQLE